MKALRQLFLYFTNLRVRYDRISNDPEKKDKSVYFGVRSIISSVLGAVVIVLCSFGISALMANDNIVAVIGIVILALVMLSMLFECTVRAIIEMIYQLRLNKQPVGWVALAVFLITFIAMILLSILFIAKII